MIALFLNRKYTMLCFRMTLKERERKGETEREREGEREKERERELL